MAYQNFCRMSPADYADLLALVSPYITYKDTRWRKATSPDERLAVTLRFLQGVSVAASPVIAIVGSRPSVSPSVCLSVCLSVRHTLALSENDAS